MKVALYARVSTVDKEQNPETQLYAMRNFCRDAGWEIYQEYVDRARAKNYLHRKAWQQLQKDARRRRFKVVLVLRLDRAFRALKEAINCIDDWHEHGISFKSIQEHDGIIDTTTSQGRFMFQMVAAFAELESGIIGERVRAGMARAKAEGRSLGRKMLDISVIRICDELQACQSIGLAAGELKCSRAYIYQELAKYGTTPLDVIKGSWQPPDSKPNKNDE